jgi:rRNA maturation endonuclease Nob1
VAEDVFSYDRKAEQEDRENVAQQRELETFGDMVAFANDPDIKKLDPSAFTKDTILANLSDAGIKMVAEHFELARELRLMKLGRAEKFIVADGLDFVVLSNARKGFARKQIGTSTRDYNIKNDAEEQKSKYLPEIRRKKKGGVNAYE